MKKLAAFFALLLIAFGVFVWQLPASVIAAFVPTQASKFVQLHRVSGSLWNGRALLSVIGVAPAIPVAWACRPSMSPAGVRCELQEGLTGAVTVDALNGSLHVERVTALLPVQYMMGANMGAASTGVTTDIASATVSPQTMTIKGSLRAADATYRAGAADVSLGEVSADCAPGADSRTTICMLSNRGGSGRLDGKINLAPTRANGNLELVPATGPVQRIAF